MQTVAVAAYLDGRSDDAIAIGVESLALATAMGWPFARLSATMCFVMGHSASGGDQLIARAREGIAMSEVLGETWERGSFYQFLAVGLLRRDDLTEALRAGRRSLECAATWATSWARPSRWRRSPDRSATGAAIGPQGSSGSPRRSGNPSRRRSSSRFAPVMSGSSSTLARRSGRGVRRCVSRR